MKSLIFRFALSFSAIWAMFPGTSAHATALEPESLISIAASERWADDPQWRRLLHYGGFFGLFQTSEVDSHGAFFLDPQGHREPERELIALIRATLGSAPSPSETPNEHSSCRFPMRTRWLERKIQTTFPGVRFARPSCPNLDSFRSSSDANGASIVFSSYYINGPASTFGHTLLRLHKRSGRGQQELLDLGINFSAMVPEGTNPVAYALKGLSGGFEGRFSSVPYYFKIREYTDFESRDLWSYELNLSSDEMEDLVDHLWELGPSSLNYWFFTENCSYLVFSVLEAIRPSLELKKKLPKHTIPAETVRIAWEEPGLVKSVHFRPSARTKFEARLQSLSPTEQDLVIRVAKTEDLSDVDGVSSEESLARILDALMDYMAFRFPKADLQSGSSASSFKSRVYERRAAISMTTRELEVRPNPLLSPHLAHPTQRLLLSAGNSPRDGAHLDAEFRFAMHSLTDPEVGYPGQAEIEFLAIRAVAPARGAPPRLQEVRLLNITSLNDLTRWDHGSSFRFRVGYDVDPWALCNGCGILSARGGRGYSLPLTNTAASQIRIFGFLDAAAMVGGFARGALEGSLGASVGIHGRIHHRMALLGELTGDAFWRNQNVRRSLRSALRANINLSTRWSVVAGTDWTETLGHSGRIGIAHYF